MTKKITILFLILVTTLSYSVAQRKQSSGKKPNIIFFLVDDMGWTDTSQPFDTTPLLHNRHFRTPNMERLAREGTVFSQAYVNAVCTPTRTSLLTGASAARTHITNWTNPVANRATDFQDSLLQSPAWNINGISTVPVNDAFTVATPLPMILKTSGYQTIHVGKAHWGSQGTPGSDPMNLGFITNVGGSAIGHPQSYYGEENFGNVPGKMTFNAVPGLQEFYGHDIFLTDALTHKAKQGMENAILSGKSFFLYLGHYAVHTPLQPDKRFVQRYLDMGLDPVEAAYASLVESMDKSLGDILDFLDEKNIAKNTIIIFMSDNGGLSDHGRGGKRNTHNLPLRAGKGSLYEGGIRVPFIVKWPGVTKPASRVRQYVMAEDFFSTVLDMAGIANNNVSMQDGVSYVPLLKNPERMDSTRALIFHYPNRWTTSEHEAIAWVSAIRKGSWKLVYRMKQQKLELYNITQDIGEKNDVAVSHPEKVKELATLLGSMLRARGAQMPLWKNTGKAVVWPEELLN